MNRIKVFTGHFGSGKTEISVNYAIHLAKQGKKVALVDIDTVNPFFCSRDMAKELKEKYGIRVISADPSLSNAELMVVPAEVSAVFNDKSYEVIMDIGGDDQGATVLGQYNRHFKQEPYDMCFVINTNRPDTADSEGIATYINAIERSSRLKVSHLISNTNMSYETTVEDVIKGDREVSKFSEKTNLPHLFTVCSRELEDEVKGKVKGDLLAIDIYMKPPWR